MGTQILLIDDSETNIDGARSAGWETIRFTSPAALEAALRALGLIAPGR